MRPITVSWRINGLILALALCVRIAASYAWQDRLGDGVRFAFGDSESYWHLAQTMVRGQPFEYGDGMRMFRMPGYPALLAGLFAVSQDDDPPVLWVRCLGAVLGTITVACVMLLASQLFDERVTMISGFLASLYPGAVSISVFVLSEVLFCPLMLLQMVLWIIAGRATTGRWFIAAAGAGLMGGLATLVRPSWLLFAPCAWGAILLGSRFEFRQLRTGMVVLAFTAAAMLPWWVRGYRITGHFVVTTLQVGASLYDGWNPEATGASDMRFVGPMLQQQVHADATTPPPRESTFEYRLDQRMREAALAWAKANPRRVAELALTKFLRMWSPWPNAAEMQNWFFRAAILFGYTPLMAFGAWGLMANWRGGWPFWLCSLPAVYFTCLHVVFVSSIRYREPAMLPWIVLAASGLAGILRFTSDRSQAKDA